MQINQDVERLRHENGTLQTNLSKDSETVRNLEKLLADCRRDAAEQRSLNFMLQSDVEQLKKKLGEVQSNL